MRRTIVMLVLSFFALTALFAWAGKRAGPNTKAELAKLRAQIKKDFDPYGPAPAPANNPQTQAKIRLGEALFFDPNLSGCGTVACATCHVPEEGFADGDAISEGCGGVTGRRSSNTVYQTAWASHLFWDGRVQSLEQQALGPVVDPAEMANTWDEVLAYLGTGVHPRTKKRFTAAQKFYAKAFGQVFDGEITTTNVTKAIAAYERTAISKGAPYDRWLAGDDKALSPAQQRGLLVFFGRGNCAECHPPPHFFNSDFHNLGVPAAGFEKAAQFPHNPKICKGVSAGVDPGRAEVDFLHGACGDVGKFRTPSMRNVALTAPYMHNGALASLEKVMEHYELLAQGGIKPLAGKLDVDVLPENMRLGAAGGSPTDVADLVAFMHALTGSQLKSPKGGVAPPRGP